MIEIMNDVLDKDKIEHKLPAKHKKSTKRRQSKTFSITRAQSHRPSGERSENSGGTHPLNHPQHTRHRQSSECFATMPKQTPRT